MMNANRLSELFNNVDLANESDVQELKSLTELYPYFFKPFAVLTKIYLKKQHYRYEEYLFKTSLRCNDRAWLHDYLYDVEKLENQEVITSTVIELKSNEVEIKNSINDFLIDEIPQNHVEEKIELTIEKIDEPVENLTYTNIESETTDSNDDQTIEPAIDILEQLSNNEFVEETVIESQPLNDINQFLEEKIEAEETEKPIEFELGIANTEETNLNQETEQLEEIETEFTLGSLQVDEKDEDSETIQVADIQSLRKNPVYNVESFLNDDNEQEISANKPATAEKDFFSWLNQPNLPVSDEEKQEKTIDTLSIIDKFIELNPQISRPKKEFYNPENMAKKSEQFESLFMTETLANIYYEQGNYSLAIKAYEKLSLQNPEKQTYFASLIEKIKKNK